MLYPKLYVGGYVIIDDYGCFPDCKAAVDELEIYMREKMEYLGKIVKGFFGKKDHYIKADENFLRNQCIKFIQDVNSGDQDEITQCFNEDIHSLKRHYLNLSTR